MCPGRHNSELHHLVILLLDKNGKGVNILRGVFPRTVLERAIDDLLVEE